MGFNAKTQRGRAEIEGNADRKILDRKIGEGRKAKKTESWQDRIGGRQRREMRAGATYSEEEVAGKLVAGRF
jgi:hypothetical protein